MCSRVPWAVDNVYQRRVLTRTSLGLPRELDWNVCGPGGDAGRLTSARCKPPTFTVNPMGFLLGFSGAGV